MMPGRGDPSEAHNWGRRGDGSKNEEVFVTPPKRKRSPNSPPKAELRRVKRPSIARERKKIRYEPSRKSINRKRQRGTGFAELPSWSIGGGMNLK